MRLIDADVLMKVLKISDDCNHCEQCEYDYFCSMGGDFVSACEAIHEAPSIETKQIKYFDEDEKVWKIGSVILNETDRR